MGDAPAWYPVLRAARYLGIHPDDLLERSPLWYYRALAAEWAENAAQRDRAKHE
jgi:hypothetical protein